MLRRALLRKSPRSHPLRLLHLRFASSKTSPAARFDRVLDRLPRFLRPYTESLRSAPVSNVLAFLALHELTAIVPLVGLAGWFHWSGWIPSFLDEGSYVSEGVAKFGRFFARKGWFGFGREIAGESGKQVSDVENKSASTAGEIEEVQKIWHVGDSESRILIEVATAYAITKVLLPARIIFSVWATPWAARVFTGRAFGMAKKSAVSGNGAKIAKGVGKDAKPP